MKHTQLTVVPYLAVMLASLHFGCQQGAGGSSTANGNEASRGSITNQLKDDGAGKNNVAWTTNNTISVKRQIEVGDHPSILLETFKIGQREQKVRFFVSDEQRIQSLLTNSPQDLLLKKDYEISKSENEKWSLFGMVIQAPSLVGLQKFSDNSLYNGLAITPQVMLCAAESLKNLKEAGDKKARAFQNWQVDQVNIFVKPVQHSSEAESKMAIDPKLKALNFQVSVWTRSGDCFLPSVEEIEEAVDIADQRVHD